MSGEDHLHARIVSHEEFAEAVLIPAMHILAIDGTVNDVEAAQLKRMCDSSPIFARMTAEERERVTARVAAGMETDPAGQITQVVRVLPMDLRETAYAFAARVAAADGTVSNDEMQLLTDLAQQFGLSADRVNHIFEVIEILQRAAPTQA